MVWSEKLGSSWIGIFLRSFDRGQTINCKNTPFSSCDGESIKRRLFSTQNAKVEQLKVIFVKKVTLFEGSEIENELGKEIDWSLKSWEFSILLLKETHLYFLRAFFVLYTF